MVAKHIRSWDAFAKTVDDVRVRTAAGGVVSVVSLTAIAVLTISEFVSFLSPQRVHTLTVDRSVDEALKIYLNIDFPKVNCEVLGINVMDSTGTRIVDVFNGLTKTRVGPDGKKLSDHAVVVPLVKKVEKPRRCGSCYEVSKVDPGRCCNTCEDIQRAYALHRIQLPELSLLKQCHTDADDANNEDVAILNENSYRPNEGCNIQGHVEVARVKGRFEVLVGHSISFGGFLLHDVSVLQNQQIDISHRIHFLSFGEYFPGRSNPLDGTEKTTMGTKGELGKYEYFVKVVPTTYKRRWGSPIYTNQYSVTEYFRPSDPAKGGSGAPGLYLEFDFSPIRVEYAELRGSFFHFITQLCAIVGGVYTVAGMIDSSIYTGQKRLRRLRGEEKLM
mmetsp:Transcript_2556/g.4493  ORF Transcript_2556/g.4493 Transcript_2556/m.4493 type:complete len:388 (-) Transcript_2556:1922-3085(-)